MDIIAIRTVKDYPVLFIKKGLILIYLYFLGEYSS